MLGRMGVPLQLETRGIYPLCTLLINTRNVEKKDPPESHFFRADQKRLLYASRERYRRLFSRLVQSLSSPQLCVRLPWVFYKRVR